MSKLITTRRNTLKLLGGGALCGTLHHPPAALLGAEQRAERDHL